MISNLKQLFRSWARPTAGRTRAVPSTGSVARRSGRPGPVDGRAWSSAARTGVSCAAVRRSSPVGRAPARRRASPTRRVIPAALSASIAPVIVSRLGRWRRLCYTHSYFNTVYLPAVHVLTSLFGTLRLLVLYIRIALVEHLMHMIEWNFNMLYFAICGEYFNHMVFGHVSCQFANVNSRRFSRLLFFIFDRWLSTGTS